MSETDNNIEELKSELRALKEKEKHYKKTIRSLREARSIEVQVGTFERKIWKTGKSKKERLIRSGKNPEKVSLGFIGIMEFFTYPFSTFSKVFVRIGGQVATLDKYDLPKLLSIQNKAKWFIEKGQSVVKDTIKSDSELARDIKTAWSAGLEREKRANEKERLERELDVLKALREMKPERREKWFEDEPELRGKYNKYIADEKKKSKKRR